MDTTIANIGHIIALYKQKGDDLYKGTRPFKGKWITPDEDQMQDNHRRNEYEQQAAAREMAMLRRSIRIGDVVKVHVADGQGFTYQERVKELTICSVCRHFVVGVNQYGVRETIQIYDLWKEKKYETCKRIQDIY